MRMAAVLLVVAVVAGALALILDDGGMADSNGNGVPPSVVEFDGFEWQGYALVIPRGWVYTQLDKERKRGVGFRSKEKEDGFHPAILFYPVLDPKLSLEQFIRGKRLELTESGDPAEILADGPAVVGGMAGHSLIYTRSVRGGIQVRTIDFYFVGPKGIGMLRMLSNATTFMTWRPVFDQVAAALRRK